MNVQQLLQGSKSQSSTAASRRAEDASSDKTGAGFASALTEARRKPEPKPAEAPAARKTAATKKPKPAKRREPAADDAIAAEETESTEHLPVPEAEEAVDAEALPGETPPDAKPAGAKAEGEGKKDVEAETPSLAVQLAALTSAPVETTPADDLTSETEDVAGSAITTPKATARQTPALATPVPTADAEPPDNSSPDALSDSAGIALEDLSLDVDADMTLEAGGIDLEQPPQPHHATKVARPNVVEPTAVAQPEASDTATDEKGGGQPFSNSEGAATFTELTAVDADIPLGDTGKPDSIAASPSTATSAVPHVQPEAAKPQATPAAPAQPAPPPPQAQFVEANHPKIVTAVRGELLPQGGSMQIRLDPPELGALMVSVRMTDGVMTASFNTSSDDATRLLSHSLSQLKHALESQGVSVEKLHVQQSPRDQHAANDDQRQDQPRDQHGDAHRQEQQRKEMLRRMWRRLAVGSDPLDLVA